MRDGSVERGWKKFCSVSQIIPRNKHNFLLLVLFANPNHLFAVMADHIENQIFKRENVPLVAVAAREAHFISLVMLQASL
jgi:hypothetical protein